ncbi:hypothetical protein BTO20_37600 (plasmid) [Mycobacterium dioxanotrophicus]|jgi:hypothetical protein|uniref:Uncharacterized protein n=2 Tax=Mycobacterium dioxanotrophicus TaxID=482462 RepID=A0A1Y0CGE8_9MYCO|nr:hypothetical protein BTO20_37600 [Mycobacterium dioxanotrophicus]
MKVPPKAAKIVLSKRRGDYDRPIRPVVGQGAVTMGQAAEKDPQSDAVSQQNAAGDDPALASEIPDPRETKTEHLVAKVAELAGLGEAEAGENNHLSQTISTSLGMVAASLGAGFAAVSGGAEIAGVLLALAGVVGSILPFIGRFIARRRRKHYTSSSDIEDPVLRELIEVTAAQQLLMLGPTQVQTERLASAA